FGWLQFTNGPADDLLGMLHWFKLAPTAYPAYPYQTYPSKGYTDRTYASGTYTNGFAETLPAFGSRYVPPISATNRVLEFTNGLVELADTTSVGFTNEIVLEQGDRVTNLSSNRLVMTIVRPTGLWNGMAVDPGTGQSLPFHGAV